MTTSEQPPKKAGATPAKLAIIGVLAIVLIGVIAKNFSSEAAEPLAPRKLTAVESAAAAGQKPAAQAAGQASANAVAATTAAGPDNPFGEFAADEGWPQPPLKDVIKYDPFAPAEWAAAAKKDSAEDEALSEKQINELLSSKDAIIFMAGDKRVARIGKQEFRVG